LTVKTTIYLRPLNEADLNQLADWFACFEDLALFDRGLPVPVSREFVVESWKPALQFSDPPKSFWFIAEDKDGDPIGICGIQSINFIHGDAVVPLFVSQEHRTRGFGTALLFRLVELAFDQLRLHRLSTVYRANNSATEKLVTAAGFVEEGRIREGWYANDQHHDIVHVGLLKSEWPDKRRIIRERLAKSPFELVMRSRLQE
jgi:RimJ/RimL family protein N-acetyltransferase